MRVAICGSVVLSSFSLLASLGCQHPPPTGERASTPLASAQAPAPVPAPAPTDEGTAAPTVAPSLAQSLAPSSAPSSAPPPLAPSPAYDLAADRDARLRDAKRELGDRIPSSVEADVFVVAGPGAPGTVDFIRKTLSAYFNHRFDKKPARAISVYMFASAPPYDAFCKERLHEACMSPYGFYLPSRRLIVMNAGPGIGTLSHELVHPIMETDFPDAPTWLDEGIASLFEAPVLAPAGEIHGAKNWRLPRLLAAFASKAEANEARLDTLFGMSHERFRGDAERLHYAQARYACQWLDARGQLWPFYRAWKADFASDPTGEKSFRAITGKSPAEAHAEWSAWVRRL